MYLANHADINGLVTLTESGSTALWMSRMSSGLPIYAFSSHKKTLGRVTIYRGVFPVFFTHESMDHANVNKEILEKLKKRGLAKQGDTFIITKGDLTGNQGGTNALKVVTLGKGLTP
jgi:pyruvate kinase